MPKYLLASTVEIVERARAPRCDDDRVHHIGPIIPFELQQLHQPDRIFIRRPARIGRDAPARLELSLLVDEREHDIGVSGVDRQQHESNPFFTQTTSPPE